jgi:hypothetical protein
MLLLFVLVSFDNMILQASRTERWWMLILAISGALYCSYLLFLGRRNEIREKKILFFIGFVIIAELNLSVFKYFWPVQCVKNALSKWIPGPRNCDTISLDGKVD